MASGRLLGSGIGALNIRKFPFLEEMPVALRKARSYTHFMKTQLVITLFLALALSQQQSTAQQQKQPSQAVQSSPKSEPSINSLSLQSQPDIRQERTKGNHSHWYKCLWKPLYSNWPMAILGIVALCATFRTLRILKCQTKAAVDAAKATWISAEVQANTARAWVSIDQNEMADRIQDPYLSAPEELLLPGGRLPHCVYFVKNFGNTMARLRRIECELQIGASPSTPPNEKVFDQKEKAATLLIAPANSMAFEAKIFNNLLGTLTSQRIESIKKGGEFLWLCGRLDYEDVLQKKEHWTKFCYLWETRLNSPKPFWRIAGPKEYNDAS